MSGVLVEREVPVMMKALLVRVGREERRWVCTVEEP